MKEEEIWNLFERISHYYPSFNGDDDKSDSWLKVLKYTPFDIAYENLCKYAGSAKNLFPPHPGILTSEDDNIQRVADTLETQEHFKQLEEWKAKAVPMPEHLKKELNRLVRGSRHSST